MTTLLALMVLQWPGVDAQHYSLGQLVVADENFGFIDVFASNGT